MNRKEFKNLTNEYLAKLPKNWDDLTGKQKEVVGHLMDKFWEYCQSKEIEEEEENG